MRRVGVGAGASIAIAVLVLAAFPAALSAHLFWPTFHSAKSALSIDAQKGLQAAVVIEVPTFELLARFKQHYADLDLMKEIEAGRFDALEAKFRDLQFEQFARDLTLEIDGKPAAGKWRPVDTPINGKGTKARRIFGPAKYCVATTPICAPITAPVCMTSAMRISTLPLMA